MKFAAVLIACFIVVINAGKIRYLPFVDQHARKPAKTKMSKTKSVLLIAKLVASVKMAMY
ncbi:hypothetical protein B4U80_03303 [Leptotrombidium deliense]|uniref:Uncharacterized protein n=1 Tax=Leptotrombidium deliense TaxID=299467 RepID=A0A443RYT4_9ACAR|nr:hypothetical protein B4U80_03303 [Leptotrombidium deliense]